eukprot:gene4090-biopygen5352
MVFFQTATFWGPQLHLHPAPSPAVFEVRAAQRADRQRLGSQDKPPAPRPRHASPLDPALAAPAEVTGVHPAKFVRGHRVDTGQTQQLQREHDVRARHPQRPAGDDVGRVQGETVTPASGPRPFLSPHGQFSAIPEQQPVLTAPRVGGSKYSGQSSGQRAEVAGKVANRLRGEQRAAGSGQQQQGDGQGCVSDSVENCSSPALLLQYSPCHNCLQGAWTREVISFSQNGEHHPVTPQAGRGTGSGTDRGGETSSGQGSGQRVQVAGKRAAGKSSGPSTSPATSPSVYGAPPWECPQWPPSGPPAAARGNLTEAADILLRSQDLRAGGRQTHQLPNSPSLAHSAQLVVTCRVCESIGGALSLKGGSWSGECIVEPDRCLRDPPTGHASLSEAWATARSRVPACCP